MKKKKLLWRGGGERNQAFSVSNVFEGANLSLTTVGKME